MATAAAGDSKNASCSDTRAPGTVVPGNTVPEKIDRYLDVVAYSPGGDVILVGASSLTTTLWRGSVWILKDANLPADASLQLSPADCQTGISVETGVSSGIFLNNSKFLVGCDSGALHLYGANENVGVGDSAKNQIELLALSNEHSSTVVDLDILENEIISCSQDSSIKVWDIANLASQHTYSPAHSRMVTSVKTQPNSSHTFASTSADGTALMWDIRESKPARALYTMYGVGLSAVTWSDPNKVVLGAFSGGLNIVDVRKSTEPTESIKLVPRPVHRLHSSPQDLSLIAVCQDTSQFSVIKCKDDNTAPRVYQDNRHDDYIRCAAWHPGRQTAVTCSWDSTVLTHCISPVEAMNGF